jgi:hypothetical protein
MDEVRTRSQLLLATIIMQDMSARGFSTEAADGQTIPNLWSSLLTGDRSALSRWYAAGSAYWDDPKVPTDIEGVLGGLGYVSERDIVESERFLRDVTIQLLLQRDAPSSDEEAAAVAAAPSLRPWLSAGAVLDVGAGVGRVSQHLLQLHFPACVLLESCLLPSSLEEQASAPEPRALHFCEP